MVQGVNTLSGAVGVTATLSGLRPNMTVAGGIKVAVTYDARLDGSTGGTSNWVTGILNSSKSEVIACSTKTDSCSDLVLFTTVQATSVRKRPAQSPAAM